MNDSLFQKQLCGIRRTAKLLGLSAVWLKAEIEAGRIPHLKAGRRILLNPEAVKAELVRRASEEVPS